MSGTGSSAIGVNVNKTGAHTGFTSTKGANNPGVVTGGSAIVMPKNNRPEPSPSYFAEAVALRKRDARYRDEPR